MDELKELALNNLSKDNIDRTIHNIGHFVVAAYFNQIWRLDIKSDEHEFLPDMKKYATYTQEDRAFSIATIYAAGSAAEDIYHDGYKEYASINSMDEKSRKKVFEKMKYTHNRLFTDLRLAYPEIMRYLKLQNRPCNYITYEELPVEITERFISYAQKAISEMALIDSKTPKEFLEDKITKIALHEALKSN